MPEKIPSEGVSSMQAHARARFVWLAATAVACATAPKPVAAPPPAQEAGLAPAPAPDRASDAPASSAIGLRFEVQPMDAEVFVDGARVGRAGPLGAGSDAFKVDPGLHQITIRCKGYQTWRAEVAVRERVEAIRVTLVPASP